MNRLKQEAPTKSQAEKGDSEGKISYWKKEIKNVKDKIVPKAEIAEEATTNC